MSKKSFILYNDLIHTVSQLPKEIKGELFQIILDYANGNEYPIDDLLLRIAFEPIKQQMLRDKEDWESERQKRSEAGKKGGLARSSNASNDKKEEPIASNAKQFEAELSNAKECLANQADNVTVTVNVTDNVINKEKNIKKEKSANASMMVVDDVVGYFNEKAGTNKYQTGSDRQSIAKYTQAIIKAGDTLEDIKLVIDYKLANPNTKKIELTAWLNTAYIGNNMADAKTWHARGRPRIEPITNTSLFAKPERLVPSLSKHDPSDNPDIDSLNI